MPQFCAVIKCGSNSASVRDRGVRFYKFPSERDSSRKINEQKQRRRRLWIQALRRDDLTENKLKNERVCSRHFISGAPADLNDEDNPDWVPNVSLGYIRALGVCNVAAERFNRRVNRNNNKRAKVPEQKFTKMVYCCAFDCNNRSEKGVVMKTFPRDPVRRKAWTEQVNRDNWSPSNHSVLCEAHFEPYMWEKTRVDGKTKLKSNAIPTIFSANRKKAEHKAPAIKVLLPETKDLEGVIFSTVAENNNKELPINDRHYKQKTVSHNPILEKIFNLDKIEAIKGTSVKWSNATIENALKLKFACGDNRYEEISKGQTPMPSLKSLEQHLLNLSFDGGILTEVLDILKLKVSNFTSNNQRDCAVFLKEIPIISADVYEAVMDKDSDVTLNEHSGVVTHILVVILGGISISWKQLIAIYYTGNFVNTSLYTDIVLNVIDKTEQLGLKVISITSDIDSSRQSLWKNWNMTTEEDSKIKNYIIHPFDSSRNIFILADVTSLFKNIKNVITSNQSITIPRHIQERHHLVSNIAESQHMKDLINFQDKLNFKLVPTLLQENLKVEGFKNVTELPSAHDNYHDVISGLNFLADKLKKPEYKTTGWLIETIEKWFTLMTTSSSATGLSKQNLEVYNESIAFLKEFIQLVCQMQINGKVWKPHTRIGVILCTQSVLDIQNLFLNKKRYDFLPTSRLTQHYSEDLNILEQGILDAVGLQYKLRLICVAQLLKDFPNINHVKNENKMLSELANIKIESKIPETNNIPINSINEKQLTYSELNSLYSICSYIISTVKKTTKTCGNCLNSVGFKNGDDSKYKKFFRKNCFRRHNLFFCNDSTFEYFIKLEKTFCDYSKCVRDEDLNIEKFHFDIIMGDTEGNHILNCHNLKKKIVKRFISFRINIANKKRQSIENKTK